MTCHPCHVTCHSCHVSAVAGLSVEDILSYFVEQELAGEVTGDGLVLPFFSELSVSELEQELDENDLLQSLIM